MPSYRLIGYYNDSKQVYDGTWDGEHYDHAVHQCLRTLYERDSDQLCLVAILDESGRNVYEYDAASFACDWREP